MLKNIVVDVASQRQEIREPIADGEKVEYIDFVVYFIGSLKSDEQSDGQQRSVGPEKLMLKN